jgi:hypothetical protein
VWPVEGDQQPLRGLPAGLADGQGAGRAVLAQHLPGDGARPDHRDRAVEVPVGGHHPARVGVEGEDQVVAHRGDELPRADPQDPGARALVGAGRAVEDGDDVGAQVAAVALVPAEHLQGVGAGPPEQRPLAAAEQDPVAVDVQAGEVAAERALRQRRPRGGRADRDGAGPVAAQAGGHHPPAVVGQAGQEVVRAGQPGRRTVAAHQHDPVVAAVRVAGLHDVRRPGPADVEGVVGVQRDPEVAVDEGRALDVGHHDGRAAGQAEADGGLVDGLGRGGGERGREEPGGEGEQGAHARGTPRAARELRNRVEVAGGAPVPFSA